MKWSIQTPKRRDRRGEDLAGELGTGASTRKSSIAPTTQAHRGAEQDTANLAGRARGTRARHDVPKKIASPPSRGSGRRLSRRASGLSTTPSSRAIPPTAGVRSDDDQECDRSAVERPRGDPEAPASPALLRAVQAVACVTEARHDVALLVELRGRRRDDDRHVGMVAWIRAIPSGAAIRAISAPSAAPAAFTVATAAAVDCRWRASGRAGSRHGPRCRSAV